MFGKMLRGMAISGIFICGILTTISDDIGWLAVMVSCVFIALELKIDGVK